MEVPQSKKEKRRIKDLHTKRRIVSLEISVAEYDLLLRNSEAENSRLRHQENELKSLKENLALWAAWCRGIAEGKSHYLDGNGENCGACEMPWPCPAATQTGAK